MKVILGSIVAIALVTVATILAATGVFRPTPLLPQSVIYESNGWDTPSEEVSTLASSNYPTNDTPKELFFAEVPWEENTDGHFFGVLEFCSDGNETYAYGLLGHCKPGQPSPLIRMKPKHHYHLILVNNAHIDTNLHTHGLHVSGVGRTSKKNALSFLVR